MPCSRLVLILILTAPWTARAISARTIQKVPRPGFTDEEVKSFEQKALDAGDYVAKRIDSTATAIDLTLAGKRYTKKENESKAVISELVTYDEKQKLHTSPDFGLNLQLPNVEKRWQLRFTSYDEEREERDLAQRRVRTRARDRDYGAGIGFFQKLGHVRTAFLPRLQLKNPLQMNYTLRFQSDGEIEHLLHLTPRVDLYADAQKGTGEYAELPFHLQLTPRMEFSFVNSEEYKSNANDFTTQHEVAIDYLLTYDKSCGAALNASTWNRGAFHLENWTMSVSFGQEVYVDRLKYGVSPFWSFSKDDDFKGKAGISVTGDLIF